MFSLCNFKSQRAGVLPAGRAIAISAIAFTAFAVAAEAAPKASLLLSASNPSPRAGQSVMLNIGLTITGSTAPSMGSYSIFDGSTALVKGAAGNTANGFAYATSSLGVGAHVLTAKYAGTVNGLSATSNSIAIEVSPAAAPLAVLNKLLPPAYVGTDYPGIQLDASGGKSPYHWSLAAAGALPSGMALSGSGDVTGDPEDSAPALEFKVNVKDSSSPAKTGSATISMPVYAAVAKCNSAGSSATTLKWLSGNYAFHIDQIDLTGSGVVSWVVGQFKADGQGHITNAIMDSNGPSYIKEQGGSLKGGSYSIGSDGRGELILMTPGGAIRECIAVASLKNGVSGNGQFVEADSSDTAAHGVFFAQGGSAATKTSVKGSWAFGIQGAKLRTGGVVTRQAAAGYLTLNGAGKVTGGEFDFSSDEVSSGSLVNQYRPQASLTGTYAVAADGRGTLALEASQGGSSETFNFVFYMAGPDQMLLLQTDQADEESGGNGSMTGRALLRSVSSFSGTALSGSSVFISNGATIHGLISGPKQEAGILKWDNGTVSGSADVNEDGKVTLASANAFTAHYSVDAEGRVAPTEVSGGGSAPVFYLSGPNAGFGVQAEKSVDASELFDQSVPSGGFKASSFSGGYAIGSIWYDFVDQIASSGEVVVNASTENASEVIDVNEAGEIAIGAAKSVKFDPAADGRFILMESGHPSTALYMVSKDLAFGVNISGDASQPLVETDFFEQNP